jgi:hypothetical protein
MKSCHGNGGAEVSSEGEWVTIARPERTMRLRIELEK